jgi:hypothetical protein
LLLGHLLAHGGDCAAGFSRLSTGTGREYRARSAPFLCR